MSKPLVAHMRPSGLSLLTLLIALLLVLPGTGYTQDSSDLTLGNPVTRAISGRSVHRYHVSPDVPYARLQLVKRGIDLEFRISARQGGELFRIADWRGREGWLSALLEQDTAREFLLEVSAVTETAPPGEYVISLDQLPEAGTNAKLRIDAERTMTRADHTRYSHYLGSGGSREQALELFQIARDLFSRTGFPREEARASFSIAMIQQELGHMSAAQQTYQEVLDLWRGVGDERDIAASLHQLGMVEQGLGLQSEALDHLNEARAIREKLGDTYFLAHSANNIGMLYLSMGKSRIAMKYLVQALEAYQAGAELRVPTATLRQEDYFQSQLTKFRTGGDFLAAAGALNNLAWVHSVLGEFEDALNYYQNYRFLAEFLDNDERAAQATLNIGQTYFEMSEHQKALDHSFQALEFFAGPKGNPYWHSLALDNLGKVHLQIGDYQRALDFFERALALRTREDNPKGRADTLQRLGEAYAALGEPGKAIDYFRQSLELRQTAIDRYREALTLDQMGVAQASLSLFDDALASHKKALEIHRAAGNRRGETESLVNLGRFYASQNQPTKAVEHLQQALLMARDLGDRVWETQGLFELAKVDMNLGRTPESFAHLEEALAAIDSLRGDLISPELRASFFATQLEVHRFYIDGLMSLARNGDRASSEAAFVVAERAKQRTLLDYLANTGNMAVNTDIELLKHREELQRDLDANEQERLLFANKPEQAEQLAIIEKRVRDITADLERVQIRISGQRAPELELTENVVSVSQVAPLLGADTVLLEYALGEDRSYVWVIGDGVYDVAILPSEMEIETRVRKLFAGLRTNNPSEIRSERDQLEQLGSLLLGPIAAHLGGKRLAIIPDGVLHYLPFTVLGDPRSNASHSELVDSNEIIVLPSASGLLGLRKRASSFGKQAYRIAVLADPVFTVDDPRVAAAVGDSGAVVTPDAVQLRLQAGIGQSGFSRLPGTLYEAEIIQELTGPGKTLVLTGFAANRGQLTSGSLDDYNVLHLATHGIVNPTHPGLSGVVLSALDSEGRKQPSFVRALDLFYMHIGARLVVLSACETALGKEILGEGLMGMTHGFFYAGANTVVSSLWQVPDRATAELMRHFYTEMLQNGRSPATALRLAQLKIRDQRRWRDPYYWAAFIVQGDWR
jgi:CHAT domain-containing protein/tetratricopeptide (TPR) repeat protein